MPKVSVIVLVYGVEHYIERCVRSLFQQTLEEIEFIFVDDCTPDRSMDILESLMEEYPLRKSQSKVIHLPYNMGQCLARKKGMEVASGDYVIHCDSDDWVELDMYEELYQAAVNTKSDIVFCNYFDSIDEFHQTEVKLHYDFNKHSLISGLLSHQIPGFLWNKLVSRKLYSESLQWPKGNILEDLTLMLQFVYHAEMFTLVEKPFYHYFRNENSITREKTDRIGGGKKNKQSMLNYLVIEDFLNTHKITPKFIKEIKYNRIRFKLFFADMTYTDEGRREWEKMFPDISLIDVLCCPIHWKQKVFYFLLRFNLYKKVFKQNKS